MNSNNRNGISTLIVVIGGILLACFIGVVTLLYQANPPRGIIGTPLPSPTRTRTVTPTRTTTPTRKPTATLLPTVTLFPTSAATESAPAPTSSAPGTPAPIADHYWLMRPIALTPNEQLGEHATWFYSYGETDNDTKPVHFGVDLQNYPNGTPLLAMADGTVIVGGSDKNIKVGPQPDFYGNVVVIQLDRDSDGKPVFALIGHMSKVVVNAGQHVKAGDLIGEVGESGVALGPHPHVEVRVGKNTYNDTRNPMLWLEPFPGTGTIAGWVKDKTGKFLRGIDVQFYRADALNKLWRTTTTYEDQRLNPDDEFGENFVMGDVPAGNYRVLTRFGGKLYIANITVEAGKTTFVTLGGQ